LSAFTTSITCLHDPTCKRTQSTTTGLKFKKCLNNSPLCFRRSQTSHGTPVPLQRGNHPQGTTRLTVTVSEHHSVSLRRSVDPVTGDRTIGEELCALHRHKF
jgi:hypothetical protein